MGKPYIYLFRRIKDNSPVYVGQHNGTRSTYVTGGVILRERYVSLGKKKFWKYYSRETICSCEIEDTDSLEIRYIKEFNTFHDDNIRAYNLTRGGYSTHHTESTKKELSKIVKKHWASLSQEEKDILAKKQKLGRRNRTKEEERRESEVKSRNQKAIQDNMTDAEQNSRNKKVLETKSKWSPEYKNDVYQRIRDTKSNWTPSQIKNNSRKIVKANIKWHSEMTTLRREKMSNKMKLAWEVRSPYQCPYCDMSSKNMSNMSRYHFNKCKNKPV